MTVCKDSLRDFDRPLTKGRSSVKNRREQGIALITTLLILLLLSTIIVGIAWLVTGDQKLGGNNSDRQLAFYGAEAGMESLTASLENLFDANYSPDGTAINALMTNPGPPSNIPNVQYIAPGSTTPGSGYQITFTPSTSNGTPNPNLPATSWGTIPTGDNDAGLVALMTPYTLTVTARTVNGSEVRLQREVQTVGIPVFQFGFFSQMDLAFFAGPNFNFGGRVHTNGNLWLSENTGNTLTMSQKVTAAGEIITKNLENGFLTSSGYTGTVDITNGSGVSNLYVQSPQQSVLGNTNYYGSIGAYDTTFKAMANSVFNNNIGVAQTGVQPLNVSIATPAIGGQPIDLIRRPQPNENNTNPAKLVERYYGNPGLSMRILLSDYGSDGTCGTSDISSSASSSVALPNLSPNGTNPTTPIDLATLAWNTGYSGTPAANTNNGSNPPPYNAAPSWLSSYVGNPVFPLPVSGATTASYSSANGYWIQNGYPIITGCIKIEYQSNSAPGTWIDVTAEILKLGYTGRNINPLASASYTAPPALPALPTSQVAASGPTANTSVTPLTCTDPSPNAVIRLARVRDNPNNTVPFWKSSNTCGAWSTSASNQYGTDFWPNVLFDPREGQVRDTGLYTGTSTTQWPLAGAMYYVELDVTNLAQWFTGAIGSSGKSALNTDGYAVYFSDRRSELPDPNPPASVGAAGSALTGGYGYEDLVNPASNSGCPNDVLDSGEDVESDYVNGVSQNTATTPRTYGGTPTFNDTTVPSVVNYVPIATLSGSSSVLQSNPNCSGTIATPLAVVASGSPTPTAHPQELRENPPLLFRRALKLVHADTISLGTCNTVSCGLTIAAENPVYVQACYNNPGKCNMTSVSWSTTSVGASIVADAVTLLSDTWNDVNSFAFPYGKYSGGYNVTNGGRNATASATTYRVAVAAGKGIPFKQPTFTGVANDYGTDGGAHNFLRYIENWTGTLYYEGSIVSMYYSHQAQGLYKCCTVVYSPPTRGYQFDTNFLTPSLLPPLTPMLRSVNTIGFTQMLLPTQ